MKQAVGLQWRMGGGPRAAARLRCAPAGLALGWYEPGLRPERQRANANPGNGRRTERCIYVPHVRKLPKSSQITAIEEFCRAPAGGGAGHSSAPLGEYVSAHR